LSSAILYLAIVAIWAGVLIPRWLRNDAGQELASAPPQPREAPGETASGSAGADGAPGEDQAGERADPGRIRDRRRARVVTARRRLLCMLLVLTAGAAFIAATRLAASWVVVPPAMMLAGYLLLLREAAKADTERRRAEQAATARAQRTRMEAEAQIAAYERAVAGQPEADDQPETVGQHAEDSRPGQRPAAPAQPAATAEVLDISAMVAQEPYDQYADAELRAVGD
jgi:hypothetical protein